ncbi:hypothetical protein AAG570_011038 [Ranatra chinensis]|uniref:Uncharacterized protein n=1 Tax=Ranatra chinensis TaxID=642074 RepID=A0ABD0YJR0_9HEMI
MQHPTLKKYCWAIEVANWTVHMECVEKAADGLSTHQGQERVLKEVRFLLLLLRSAANVALLASPQLILLPTLRRSIESDRERRSEMDIIVTRGGQNVYEYYYNRLRDRDKTIFRSKFYKGRIVWKAGQRRIIELPEPEDHLDAANKLYVDKAINSRITHFGNNAYSIGGDDNKRLTGVADPLFSQDVVTLAYLEDRLANFYQLMTSGGGGDGVDKKEDSVGAGGGGEDD